MDVDPLYAFRIGFDPSATWDQLLKLRWIFGCRPWLPATSHRSPEAYLSFSGSNLHGFITKRIAPESNGLQHHFTHSHLQFTISRTEAFTWYLTWTILHLYTFTNEQNFLRKTCCYPNHFPSNCGSVWKLEEKPWNTSFHPLGNHPFPCQDIAIIFRLSMPDKLK